MHNPGRGESGASFWSSAGDLKRSAAVVVPTGWLIQNGDRRLALLQGSIDATGDVLAARNRLMGRVETGDLASVRPWLEARSVWLGMMLASYTPVLMADGFGGGSSSAVLAFWGAYPRLVATNLAPPKGLTDLLGNRGRRRGGDDCTAAANWVGLPCC